MSHFSVAEMHNALNWKLLDKRRHDHSLIFMYKITNYLTPEYLRNDFEAVTHSHSSRLGERFYQPKPRTEYLKKYFKYRCAKAYTMSCLWI